MVLRAGKMELFSPKFFPLVRRVLDQQGVVALGTIPILMPGGRVIKEVSWTWLSPHYSEGPALHCHTRCSES